MSQQVLETGIITDRTTANDDFLAEILLKGKLAGKVGSPEEVDFVFNQLVSESFEDTIYDAILDFINMDNHAQDDLYSKADQIIMDSPLIAEENDALRSGTLKLLDDKLTALTQAIEVVVYGFPIED